MPIESMSIIPSNPAGQYPFCGDDIPANVYHVCNGAKGIDHKWLKSPPEYTPFLPCWVTNGTKVFMATWLNGEWVIGKGFAYTPDEITHYQFLEPPLAPGSGLSEFE